LHMAGAAADRDTVSALDILDGLYCDGRDMASLLGELASLMRDVLVFKLSTDSPLLGGAFSRAELSRLSKKLEPERIFSWLEVIREAMFGLSRGGSVKLSAEMCLIRMSNERLSDDKTAILSRLARLEGGFQLGNEGAGCALNGKWKMENGKLGDEDSSVQVSGGSGHETGNAEVREQVYGKTEAEAGDAVDSSDSASCIMHDAVKEPLEVPSGGVWHDILAQLEDDAPIYMLLSDSTKIQADVHDGVLNINASNPFTVGQIESKMFSEPLREAANKVLGREVIIRVGTRNGSNEESKREKLDSLSAFGIVDFE